MSCGHYWLRTARNVVQLEEALRKCPVDIISCRDKNLGSPNHGLVILKPSVVSPAVLRDQSRGTAGSRRPTPTLVMLKPSIARHSVSRMTFIGSFVATQKGTIKRDARGGLQKRRSCSDNYRNRDDQRWGAVASYILGTWTPHLPSVKKEGNRPRHCGPKSRVKL